MATRPLRRDHRRLRRGELPHRPARVAGRGDPHRGIRGDGRGGGDPGRSPRRARRHRRRAQPGLGTRVPVPGVRRRLDGQLRIRPGVRRVRRGRARDAGSDGRAALCEPGPERPRRHRRDEVAWDQSAARVQEHTTVRQRRGVRLDRRARRDGSDLARRSRPRPARRAGDGTAAADDRRRPADREGGPDARSGPRPARACREAVRWP